MAQIQSNISVSVTANATQQAAITAALMTFFATLATLGPVNGSVKAGSAPTVYYPTGGPL